MAIGTMTAIGAGLGALGGAFGSDTTSTTQKNLGQASSLENFSGQMTEEQLRELNKMAGAGVTAQDTMNAADSQRGLAQLFGQASQNGLLPQQQDITRSNDIAGQLFGAQQLQLQQAFGDQSTQNNRLAAQLGRSVDDPILRAKLAQEQTRQQGVLNAQQGAYGMELAMQQPGQRLELASQQSNILNQLSQQAMANRQSVAGLGLQARGQEQNFRLQSAGSTTTGSSGGGIGGMFTGALGGFGTGAGLDASAKQASIMNNFRMQQAASPQAMANPFAQANPYAAPQQQPLYQQFGLSAPGPSSANIPLGSNVGQQQNSSFLRPQGASFSLGKIGSMPSY